MLSSHHDIMQTIEIDHGTMREEKQLKDTVLLRNLADFRPIIYNRTR